MGLREHRRNVRLGHRLLGVLGLAAALASLAGCPEELPEDTTAPAEVTGLAAAVSGTTVTLSWTDPEDADLAGLKLAYYPGGVGPIDVDAGALSVAVSSLVEGQTYAFLLKSLDTTGNLSEGVSVEAKVPAPEPPDPVDPTYPTVSATVPTGGATGVAVNSALSLTFSTAMDGDSIDATTVHLAAGATPVACVVSYASAVATVTPLSSLEYNTVYVLTITTAVRDLAGLAIQSAYQVSFTTGSWADTTSPTVLSHEPAGGATNIARDTVITVDFSESMLVSTVNGSSFTVKKTSDSSAVSGNVSYDAGLDRASFTPSSLLAVNTSYTVTLNTGITDMAGNPLAQQLSLIFTTTTYTGSWGEPELIEEMYSYAVAAADLEVDSLGRAICVFVFNNGTYDAYAARYESGAWLAPVSLESGAGLCYDPEVAMDSDGNAIAVWRQSDGTNSRIMANTFDEGTGLWTGATTLDEDGASGHTAEAPQVAFAPDTSAMVVWLQNDGTRVNVWAKRRSIAGAWGTLASLETLATAINTSYVPGLVYTSDDKAIASWTQVESTATYYHPWVNVYDGSWGTAVDLEASGILNCSWTSIAANTAGAATVVYTRNVIDVLSATYGGSSWGSSVMIDQTAGAPYQHAVAYAPNGDTIAIWRQSDGDNDRLWWNRRLSGGSWSSGASAILDADDVALHSVVALDIDFDGDGNAFSIWSQSDGTRNDLWIARYGSSVWGTPEVIEGSNGGIWAYRPRVRFDGSGNAIAVWGQTDGDAVSMWAARYVK